MPEPIGSFGNYGTEDSGIDPSLLDPIDFPNFNGGPYRRSNNPGAQTPPAPRSFQARLLSDDQTVQLTCLTKAYARIGTGVFATQNVRFYFTSMPLEQLNGYINPTTYNALFGRAQLLVEVLAPPKGGQIQWEANFANLGTGVYWCTQYNSEAQGSLESPPAGPALLASGAYQDALDHIPPDPVTISSVSLLPFFNLNSDLLYENVAVTYNVPALQQHFFGVFPVWDGYFSNFGTSLVPEGAFNQWDGKNPSTVTFTLQADYNSAGFGNYLTPHNVTLYLVSVNQFHSYTHPYTSHGSILFVNGIGS